MKNSVNIAVIPAYKPGMEMTDTVRELKEAGFEVVVVNDGSGNEFDHVFDIARELTTVVEHDVNKGKGEALKTGIRYIREHYPEPYIIVTADADGQHKNSLQDLIRRKGIRHPDRTQSFQPPSFRTDARNKRQQIRI